MASLLAAGLGATQAYATTITYDDKVTSRTIGEMAGVFPSDPIVLTAPGYLSAVTVLSEVIIYSSDHTPIEVFDYENLFCMVLLQYTGEAGYRGPDFRNMFPNKTNRVDIAGGEYDTVSISAVIDFSIDTIIGSYFDRHAGEGHSIEMRVTLQSIDYTPVPEVVGTAGLLGLGLIPCYWLRRRLA